MDLEKRFDHFAELITAGKTLEAIEQYFAADIEQVENNAPPVRGIEKAIEMEKVNLSKVDNFTIAIPLRVVDPTNGIVMGEMDIGVLYKNGKEINFREAFLQRWRDGKIIYQRFYYNI